MTLLVAPLVVAAFTACGGKGTDSPTAASSTPRETAAEPAPASDASRAGGGDAGQTRDESPPQVQAAPKDQADAPDAGGSAETDETGELDLPLGTGPGCQGGTQSAASAVEGRFELVVGDRTRSFVLSVPPRYDARHAVPVLVALHGTTADAEDFLADYYGAVRTAAGQKVMVVAPNGLVRDGESGWLYNAAPNGSIFDPQDVAFIDALLAHLARDYCVDSKRIFGLGHSAGAYFLNHFVCARPSVLRGIASFAGGGPEILGLPKESCDTQVAAFIGHNPYECETSGPGCPWAVPFATTGWLTTQYWARANGCLLPAPRPIAPYEGEPPCQALAGCQADVPVTLCLYDYNVPPVGPHAFPAHWGVRTALSFFLALPRPPTAREPA